MPSQTLPADEREARVIIKSVVRKYPGAIHIFSGWKGNPKIQCAWKEAARDHKTTHVVVAEPFRGWGVRYYTRHLSAFLYTLPHRNKLDLVLAMGSAGVSFYRQVGLPRKKIFPFIYQAPEGISQAVGNESQPLRLVYLGKFDARKGLEDLLRALAKIKTDSWNLAVIGDGPERARLQEISNRLGLETRVSWKGVLPYDKVMQQLGQYDVAVVPSRFDGWGMATNEAIQSGLGVVVSDKASSKDLVKHSKAGIVFKAGDSDDLARSLEGLANDRSRIAEMKKSALNYKSCISGKAVAQYLVDVLCHDINGTSKRPLAPWMESDI